MCFLYVVRSLVTDGRKEHIMKIGQKKNQSQGTEESDKVNEDILSWFCEKWKSRQAGVDEKNQFYQWVEANYKFHSQKAKGNRAKFFLGAKKQSGYGAVMKGARQVYVILNAGVVIAGGTAFGSNVLKPLIGKITIFQNIPEHILYIAAIVLAVLVLAACLFVFNAFFITEYTKQNEKVTKRRETWLRHVEALQNYQYELMNYILDAGEYRKCLIPELKDRLLIERIMAVWKNNAKKFHQNMDQDDDAGESA